MQVVNGGTSSGTVNWQGETYALQGNGRAVVGDAQIEYNTYYVGGETSISNIATGDHYNNLEDIQVMSGGTLNVDAVSNASIHADDNSTVTGEKAQAVVQIVEGATVSYADGLKAGNGSAEFSGDVQVTNGGGSESTFSVTNDGMEVQANALTFGEGARGDLHLRCGVVVDTITNESGYDLLINQLVASELSTVSALSGDIQILSTQGDMTIHNLVIEADQGVLAVGGTGAEVTVTVTETLTGGQGSLYANLDMADGSAMLLEGSALQLGSVLSLGTGIQLDAITLQALDNLADGAILRLVTAADGTTLTYTGDYGEDVWYGSVFSRTAYDGDYELKGDFNIVFDETDGFGLKKFSNTPEPTTGTLSLLALMALAARRRRH